MKFKGRIMWPMLVVLMWVPPPVAPQARTLNNYQMNPKPCWVKGLQGKCMFVWECINSGGRHVGMCVEAFMFGTCCAHNLTEAELSLVSVVSDGQRKPGSQSRPSDFHTTRPTFITRPHSKPSSHLSDNKWNRPSSQSVAVGYNEVSENHVEGGGESGGQAENQPSSWSGGSSRPSRPSRPTKLRPAATTTHRPPPSSSTTTFQPPTTTAPPPPTTTTTTTTRTPTRRPLSAAHESAQCGMPPLHPRPETRIVGGRNAQFGVWPWQVSVRRTSFFGFSSTHRCGGALINEKWIATAGHCVDDLLTSQIRIRVGEYDFSSVEEPYPFVERGVGRKVVHPKYNFFTYEFDLALVKLDSPLQFAPHISPICLPASDDLLIGENATVTGWGRLSDGGTLPSVLQEVTVPIISNDRCRNMFLRAGRYEIFPEIFMCAGFDDGGRDACQGDSGGPLQVRGKDGRYFLAGIISWGIGCAEANLPGVCTRISKFVPWILETVA